jgi:hypothetical protein
VLQSGGRRALASPGSPLNNHSVTKSEEILSELPLKVLDPRTSFTIPEVDLKRVHPFVGTEADGTPVLLKLLGTGGLARARQAANYDEPGTDCHGAISPGADLVFRCHRLTGTLFSRASSSAGLR